MVVPKVEISHTEPTASSSLLLAYAALIALWGAAQVVLVPVPLNLIATSALIIHIGSHRSLRLRDKGHPDNAESETISKDDAYKFPVVGSAVLFGLYLLVKLFDKDLINLLISAYFALFGALAIAGTLEPVVAKVIPPGESRYGRLFVLPWLGELDLRVNATELTSVVLGGAFSAAQLKLKHWALANVVGISFCVQTMERVSIGSYQVGAILLCGLFVYDVFWVFGTEVMVTVAKSIDAPIKLLFPAKFSDPTADPPVKGEFSMLGLGDIVIPGIFIALLLRYDAERAGVPAENGGGEGRRFKKGTFRTSMVAYVGGLAVTLFVMRYFNAAQPALLYLVPACLLASAGAAAARGELRALWRYSEEGDETAADKDKGQDGAGVEGLAESSTVATSAAATTATVSTAPDGKPEAKKTK